MRMIRIITIFLIYSALVANFEECEKLVKNESKSKSKSTSKSKSKSKSRKENKKSTFSKNQNLYQECAKKPGKMIHDHIHSKTHECDSLKSKVVRIIKYNEEEGSIEMINDEIASLKQLSNQERPFSNKFNGCIVDDKKKTVFLFLDRYDMSLSTYANKFKAVPRKFPRALTPYKLVETLQIYIMMAISLNEGHKLNMIHPNITLDSFMITYGPERKIISVKLVDFVLSKALDDNDYDDPKITQLQENFIDSQNKFNKSLDVQMNNNIFSLGMAFLSLIKSELIDLKAKDLLKYVDILDRMKMRKNKQLCFFTNLKSQLKNHNALYKRKVPKLYTNLITELDILIADMTLLSSTQMKLEEIINTLYDIRYLIKVTVPKSIGKLFKNVKKDVEIVGEIVDEQVDEIDDEQVEEIDENDNENTLNFVDKRYLYEYYREENVGSIRNKREIKYEKKHNKVPYPELISRTSKHIKNECEKYKLWSFVDIRKTKEGLNFEKIPFETPNMNVENKKQMVAPNSINKISTLENNINQPPSNVFSASNNQVSNKQLTYGNFMDEHKDIHNRLFQKENDIMPQFQALNINQNKHPLSFGNDVSEKRFETGIQYGHFNNEEINNQLMFRNPPPIKNTFIVFGSEKKKSKTSINDDLHNFNNTNKINSLLSPDIFQNSSMIEKNNNGGGVISFGGSKLNIDYNSIGSNQNYYNMNKNSYYPNPYIGRHPHEEEKEYEPKNSEYKKYNKYN